MKDWYSILYIYKYIFEISSNDISKPSLDSYRDFITLISAKVNACPDSFLIFILPTFLTRSSPVFVLFLFIFLVYPLYAIVEFQRDASFRNPRQSRRGFANTKTFLRRLKSLDSVALLLAHVSGLKRKTLRLPFSAR